MITWSELWFYFIISTVSISALDGSKLVVVIVGQQEGRPNALHLRDEILQQIDAFSSSHKPALHVIPDDWNIRGAWSILPLLPRIVQLHPNATWILFLQENSQLRWGKFLDFIQRYDHNQNWFIGHALHDRDATIIHHFAFHNDPSAFKYPHMDAGFVLSQPLLKWLNEKITKGKLPYDFAIDPQHELALFIWDKGNGVNLTHSSHFCLHPSEKCVTWIKPFEPCGNSISRSDVFFAVKTCSQFHADRVTFVQQTWAVHASRVVFFSDVIDSNIPTVSFGIPNTERGHCAKTMAIIHYMGRIIEMENDSPNWFIIVDDDTILSVGKLQQLLPCYDWSEPLLIGQRYGYAVGHSHGYDYITGGGGMVLSKAAVKLISETNGCHCPQADTPDDMWLGACAEALGISIIHFSGFHQARPADYSPELLNTQFVVSFHKHWMINPVNVYMEWFASTDQLMRDDATGKEVHIDGNTHILQREVPSDSDKSIFTAQSRDEL